MADVSESGFQAWYAERAKRLGLDANPDAPEHFYDYRAAYAAGAEPDASGHWPSQYKREGHPRMVINGVNTKTGQVDERPAPPQGEKDDVSGEYMESRVARSEQANADQFMDWLVQQRGQVAMPLKPDAGLSETNLDPFPTDRQPPADQSAAGTVMRNVAEIPRGAALGVDQAIRHATDWAVGPLVNWLNTNVANLEIPVRDTQTATGKITKSVAEFLTGFIPSMKGLGLMGMAGKVTKPLTAAAIADFATKDPHEARLSDLWKEMGLPQNVLTDYLAHPPPSMSDMVLGKKQGDESQIEGRFKSAVESVLTGAAAEGVVAAARALRAAKGVKAVQIAEDRALIERYGQVTDEDFARVVGDPSKPMIETKVKAPPAVVGKVAGKGAAATQDAKPDDLIGGRGVIDSGDMRTYINFERMGGPDDVKAAIAEMAEKYKSGISEAQRGTITLQQTEKMADELGMSVSDLLARRRGQPFNAEEAVAARKLWQASGEKLLEAARAAADPNAGPLDQYAFRKMMAVHYAIQAEVMGARTETARALSAWRIEAGGSIERARAIDQVMQAMGGPDTSQGMARRLAMLAQSGDPAAVAAFVRKGALGNSVDAVKEIWINGLLSNPTTHAVNITSNTVVAFQQMLERGVAARIGTLTGTQGGVAPGEAMAMAYGLVTGVKDAFRLAGKALATGETGAALNTVDIKQIRAVSSEAFNMSSETGLGRAIDLIGETARIPSRFLGAEDEFFKSIGYRMELHAQALRKATSEGLSGDALAKRMRELVLDPPENLRIASADAALYNTFTNATGDVGQAFMKLRERIPAITFVLPFVKTPVNIARYTFERSPLAPLVGQWRDDIAAGGARADLALARMGTGSAAMLMALDWADGGLISGMGPKDVGEREAMRRQGWQPYSIKVGDRWYSYNRTDPIGSMFGFAADVAHAIRRGEINEDDVDEWQEVMAMGITAVSQVVVSKTYLRGLSDVSNLFSDSTRYSEKYINNMVASFLPFTALAGNIERAVDPTLREATNPWDTIKARLAGLSDTLPARRNLWGEEIKAESGIGKAYDFFSPVQSSRVKPEPIDAEILRLAPLAAQDNVEGSAPTRIGKRTSFDGVQVNFKNWPQAYDEYVRLAGNELKSPAWGLGAKDLLNKVVSGNHELSKVYNLRSDEMKILFIKEVVQQYRKLAQQKLMNDPSHADFAEQVRYLKSTQQQARLPVAK